ncbi:hypothetical protein B0J17DRAFT_723726 [Rhizoctonia solani]|nr:hypothetical protein B0J17DRAFT_723726 [Rhizoctonia solani]
MLRRGNIPPIQFRKLFPEFPEYSGVGLMTLDTLDTLEYSGAVGKLCRCWRGAALAQSALWSFIPVTHDYEGFSVRRATNLSLQRASGTNLYPSYGMFDDLAKYSLRFPAINITTERDPSNEAEHLFARILESTPQSLSELSLCLRRRLDSGPSINVTLNLRQRFFCQSLPQFTDLFASLSKIRLRGAEDFLLGCKSDLDIFLTVLDSVSILPVLSLVSMTTFKEIPGESEILGSNIIVSFPDLKTLHVEDLYFNTLQVILGLITQRPHRLALYLTIKGLLFAGPTESDFEDVEIGDLCECVSSTTVDTLLSGRNSGV